MRARYYAHVFYNNPGIYDYEYIIDMDDLNEFISKVFAIIKDNYYEIEYSEELNMIDFVDWSDFIEENKIECNEEDYFYKSIWSFIKTKVENILKDNESKDLKYDVLEEVIQIYSNIIDDANFAYGAYLFEINLFKDSMSFAKHFFSYLENTSDTKYDMKILKRRIVCINELINMNKFPNSNFHEGILNEWINIYHMINED